ncbi:unnamed protein product [Dovyalis caffra]|uniref:Uncharacterized protein n=1 Tax=Dovyalis caffra TaxID=77055 RepID=A0AAV1S301_9ROSI|nr:unnamed protein product [Dovyalis caffra]
MLSSVSNSKNMPHALGQANNELHGDLKESSHFIVGIHYFVCEILDKLQENFKKIPDYIDSLRESDRTIVNYTFNAPAINEPFKDQREEKHRIVLTLQLKLRIARRWHVFKSA